MSLPVTVFLLPGWLDSGPTHWQSHWQAAHGYTRVQQHDWQRPLRGDWQARLDEVVANHINSSATGLSIQEQRKQRSIVLVAHSLGCHLVAAWASASRHTAAIRGALLVAPPDLTRADLPPGLHNWRRPVLHKLPFPATCVVSSNDPFGSLDAGRDTATAWGARCVEVGALGHINGDSGLGDWPAGHALITDFMKEPHHGH
jgi:uncharacterized protein